MSTTYQMSRNYEALYDLLCKGGEALGWIDHNMIPRKRNPVLILATEDGISIGNTMARYANLIPTNGEVALFGRACLGLNLEWIAPSLPLAMSEEEIEKEADKWWGSEEYNRCDSTTEALKVFAMRMLANTRSKSLTVEKGRTFTEGEVKAMLADIGHHSIVFITTGEFHRHIISTAERHGVVFDPA